MQKRPVGVRGLLHDRNNPIPLARLGASLAPTLDVVLIVRHVDKEEMVVRPRDWLQMEDLELLRRLNPTIKSSELEWLKTFDGLMKPIIDDNGNDCGRVFIAPYSSLSSDDGFGWTTVSGLRASRIRHVQGVLLGEATTVARNIAVPSVGAKPLARWASEQATLIAQNVADEMIQAKSAEVVLQCGGDVDALKIVKWGANWLNAAELEERLRSSQQFIVNFRGGFWYDQKEDRRILPADFHEFFNEADIASVTSHHGGIVSSGGDWRWPKATERQGSNLEAFVRSVVARTWGKDFEENDERLVVGRVHDKDVTRSVTVFRRRAGQPNQVV
jgi:hypothetical protein